MRVDIEGVGNQFVVRNSATQEIIEVKSASLYLNKDGICEVMLYVGLGKLALTSIPRASDGVREEGKAYASHHVGENPPNTKPVPVP